MLLTWAISVDLMTRLSHPRESLEVVLAMAVAGQFWGPEARSDAVDLLRRPPWKRHRRLGGDDLSELLAGYRSGVPVNDLADTFAIHRNTVLALARRSGVAERYRLIDRQLDEARSLYEQGWSTARIGEHFGVDSTTVWRAFRRAGLTLRNPWARG
jgi:DNA-directed RNA polymerase specialized sigma24 family protein